MIRGDASVAFLAVAASIGIHVGGAIAIFKEEPAQIEGGSLTVPVRLGNSFQAAPVENFTEAEDVEAELKAENVEDFMNEVKTSDIAEPVETADTLETNRPEALQSGNPASPNILDANPAETLATLKEAEPVPHEPVRELAAIAPVKIAQLLETPIVLQSGAVAQIDSARYPAGHPALHC